jgi:dihydrofolate synthase/folylpolyglutamate synthase
VHQALARFERFVNAEKPGADPRVFRLDRMRRLLSDFGNPHHALRAVHIAGSKGKGSTAAFLASALSATGAAVGCYSSPHVISYRERISFLGIDVPDKAYVDTVDEVLDYVDNTHAPIDSTQRVPTTFELLTLTAFLLFYRAHVDFAVLETGLGGRLDATNVISPKLTVITPIELEHTEYLGPTIADIAREKGGIIKEGVPLILAAQPPEAAPVLQQLATEHAAPLIDSSATLEVHHREASRSGTTVEVRFREGTQGHQSGQTYRLTVPIPGEAQLENALVAFLGAYQLLPPHQHDNIAKGIAQTTIPGRFQRLGSTPEFILDGAHTPGSIRALLQSFQGLYSRAPVVIFGCASSKRYEEMASLLGPRSYRVIVSRPGTFKESDLEAVHDSFRRHNEATELVPEPQEAVRQAIAHAGSDRPVLVTGSFYMVAEILTVLRRAELPSP